MGGDFNPSSGFAGCTNLALRCRVRCMFIVDVHTRIIFWPSFAPTSSQRPANAANTPDSRPVQRLCTDVVYLPLIAFLA
jgi:hypothetical protein